jgi:phenylacetate-CoA ligase
MIRPAEILESSKLLRNQWKSPEQIRRIQNQKLRKLVKHSYEKVPYYRNLMESKHLKPEDVQTIEDLKKLPIVTKEMINDLPLEHTIAAGVDVKKCRTAKTSGCTAIPFQVYFNWRDARMIGIELVRNFLSWDVKPWYKIAEFSGSANLPKTRKAFDRLGIWSCLKLSTWDEPMSWINKLREWKPQVLYGFSATLKLLGKTILEKEIEGINPRIVISTSGVLDKSTRSILNQAFQTRVFDYYGSWEGGNIAWECPQCSGLHINSDMVIVEVLKDGKPVPAGQEGEVIITNLHSYAMPFIRYRQEDVIVMSEKEPICGRPFPLIKHIRGRIVDIITLPSGKRIPPHLFGNVLDDIRGVKQWRVIQEKRNLLSIEIVPVSNYNKDLTLIIEEKIRNIVGYHIKISIPFVKKIQLGPSYKIIMVSSKISNNKMDFNNLSK